MPIVPPPAERLIPARRRAGYRYPRYPLDPRPAPPPIEADEADTPARRQIAGYVPPKGSIAWQFLGRVITCL